MFLINWFSHQAVFDVTCGLYTIYIYYPSLPNSDTTNQPFTLTLWHIS